MVLFLFYDLFMTIRYSLIPLSCDIDVIYTFCTFPFVFGGSNLGTLYIAAHKHNFPIESNHSRLVYNMPRLLDQILDHSHFYQSDADSRPFCFEVIYMIVGT